MYAQTVFFLMYVRKVDKISAAIRVYFLKIF